VTGLLDDLPPDLAALLAPMRHRGLDDATIEAELVREALEHASGRSPLNIADWRTGNVPAILRLYRIILERLETGQKADELAALGKRPGDDPPLLPGQQAIYSTGAPGRPTSMQLVAIEMERRAAAGQMITASLTEEAEALVGWLEREHPKAPRLTPKTIRNNLIAKWRKLKS
jgi:hypothetical protein